MSDIVGVTPEEVNAIYAEIRRGWLIDREKERVRQSQALAEQKGQKWHPSQMRHSKKKPLGRVTHAINQKDYFALIQKYGAEAMHDREFLKDMQRLVPETVVNKL